jgi:hypothetical protein
MAISVPATPCTDPAPAQRLEEAAAAMMAHGFTIETLDGMMTNQDRYHSVVGLLSQVSWGSRDRLRA